MIKQIIIGALGMMIGMGIILYAKYLQSISGNDFLIITAIGGLLFFVISMLFFINSILNKSEVKNGRTSRT